MSLDSLDIRIMKELMRGNVRNLMLMRSGNLRPSFRSIGRGLGVDQATVRNRVKRLKEKGLIRGWHLEVNPTLFGKKLACIMLDVNPDLVKKEVIRKIASVESVALIANYMGSSLHVLISCEDDSSLANTCRMIAELSGERRPVYAQRPTSPLRFVLKQGDWQIIKSLQKDPWKPYEQVAKEVGLSSKTTRKRIARLVEAGAIQLSIDSNLSALRGVVPAALIVFYRPQSNNNQVARKIINYVGDQLFFAELGDPFCGYFALSVPNAGALERIGDWIRGQPEIRSYRTLIALDVFPVHHMNENETERMVVEAAQS